MTAKPIKPTKAYVLRRLVALSKEADTDTAKIDALVALGEHLGMFPKRVEYIVKGTLEQRIKAATSRQELGGLKAELAQMLGLINAREAELGGNVVVLNHDRR